MTELLTESIVIYASENKNHIEQSEINGNVSQSANITSQTNELLLLQEVRILKEEIIKLKKVIDVLLQ